jgi:hypothetical protein
VTCPRPPFPRPDLPRPALAALPSIVQGAGGVSRGASFLLLLLRGLRDSLGSYTGLSDLLTGLGDLDLLALLGEILRLFLAGSGDALSDDVVE